MELRILGSSSAGNCYMFDTGKEALVVECGISFQEVKKAVNFDISRIVGCLVSHEHGDHAKYVQKFIDARIDVCLSAGTAFAIGLENMLGKSVFVLPQVDIKIATILGNFKVIAFPVKHDAAEPLGFLIYHPEMGTTLFATDTYYLAHTFNGLNNILIECNYRLDILEANVETGKIPKAQRDRTLQSHLSPETCKETLLVNDLSAVNNIVLIHLSDNNSNALDFQREIHEATGKTVHIADKGMILKFNKTPF